MATQVDKLILQTEGRDKLALLNIELESHHQAMTRLAADYRQGLIAQQQYEQAMRSEAKQVLHVSEAIARTEKGMKGFTLVGKNAQLGFMELSYVLQDFAQGGLGGILNNLPRVVTLFGGPIGLGAAVGAVGVAIFVFRQQLSDLWDAVRGAEGTIPAANTKLGELEGKLKAVKDVVEGFGKEGAIPVSRIKEYNDALADRARLEKEVADAKERQSKAEDMRRKDANAARRLNPETAAISELAVQDLGGIDAVTARVDEDAGKSDPVVPRLLRELAEIQAKAAKAERAAHPMLGPEGRLRAREAFDPEIAAKQREIGLHLQGRRERAEGVVVAAREGDQAAAAKLAALFPGQGFEDATKEGVAANDAAEKADARDLERAQRHNAERDLRNRQQAFFDKGERDQKNRLAVFNENVRRAKEREEKAEAEREEKYLEAQREAGRKRAEDYANARVKQEIARANAPREAIINRFDSDRNAVVNDAAVASAMGFIDPGDVERVKNRTANAVGAVRGTVPPRDLQGSIDRNEAQLQALAEAGRTGDPTFQAFLRVQEQLQTAFRMLAVQQSRNSRFQRGPDVGGFVGFGAMPTGR